MGDGTRSTALSLPGFLRDICSAIHPLAVASPISGRLRNDAAANGPTTGRISYASWARRMRPWQRDRLEATPERSRSPRAPLSDGASAGQTQPTALVLNQLSCYHIRIIDPHPGY